MHQLDAIADHGIRRACGFAGLGIATTMLALTFDITLALRTGGTLMALVCLVMLIAGYTAPRRDMRRTEVWHALQGTEAAATRLLPRDQAQRLIAGVLRARLLWHAERVGMGALALWLLAGLSWLARGGLA